MGAPLFYRARNHWKLTEIGKLYIENSQRMLQIKKETYSQIQDMASKWQGTVRIGLTPERGIQMFTSIYPQIHTRYPNTTFQPIESDVESQVKMLDSGELDISFQTIYERKYKHLDYQNIFNEPFYLCIPKSHPLAYRHRPMPEQYPEISLSKFSSDSFTLVKKTSTMRVVIDSLFEEAGFKPKLLFESTSMRTMQKLTEGGQCCSIIPRCYAVPNDCIAYFTLGKHASWELVVACHKNNYTNKASADFIRMASDYWQAHPYIT